MFAFNGPKIADATADVNPGILADLIRKPARLSECEAAITDGFN